MKTIKVAEASDTQLDWLVAKIEGEAVVWYDKQGRPYERSKWDMDPLYQPTTNWSQMGPIIERERISIRAWTNVSVFHAYMPVDGAEWSSDGKSPLVAAVRCYVASKLGEEVEVPEELV